MASLREEASWILDDAKAGICWIAIWKTGKSWHTETFYDVEYDEGSRYFNRPSSWKIDEESAQRLLQIQHEDRQAILVNPYYCNLGPWEGMTLASLIDGIKFQYGFGRVGEITDILHMAYKAQKEA